MRRPYRAARPMSICLLRVRRDPVLPVVILEKRDTQTQSTNASSIVQTTNT
jgi:hypothetical protein